MRTNNGLASLFSVCKGAVFFAALISQSAFGTSISDVTMGYGSPGALAVGATPQTYIGGTNVSCFNAADGAIDLEISGGMEPYTVQWAGPNGYTGQNEDISALSVGTYTAIVVDDIGSMASISVVLVGPDLLTLEQQAFVYNGSYNVSCAGASDGSVDMTVVGGNAPYNISWTDGLGYSANTEDLSGIAAGFYQTVVIDANGCFATRTIELQAPAVLEITATLSGVNGFNLACSDGTDGRIELLVQGGVAPYTYAWGNGSSGQVADGLSVGEQTVVVTDAAGCSANATYELTAPEPISATANAFIYANGGNTSCVGVADGAIAANVSGGTPPYELVWTGPSGYSSTEGTINGLAAGNYQLIVTDGNGCERSVTTTLSDPEPINISLVPTIFQGGYKLPCAGSASGSIQATVSGGTGDYFYSWSGPGSFSSDLRDIGSLEAGVYVLEVFDGKGCPASDSIDLTAPDPLTITLGISDHYGSAISCAGDDGTIEAIPSGGTMDYVYAWSSTNGFSSGLPNIGGLGIGSYTLNIVDANGCELDTTVTLTAPEPLQAQFDVQTIACANIPSGSIDLTISGGGSDFTYNWSGPGGFNSTAEDLTGLNSGSYSVTVMDKLGCVGEFATSLNAPTTISSGTVVSFFGQFELQCANDSSGFFDLHPQGGTGPFEVSVSGPNGYVSSSMSNTRLVAGIYEILISDHAGCTLDTTITLSQPHDVINVDLAPFVYPSGTNISCFGVTDGSVDATVLGGVAPYTIVWSGPDGAFATQEDLYALAASDQPYALVITDNNQCTFTTSVILNGPVSSLHVDMEAAVYPGGANISCSTAQDGSIGLSVGGGNGGYTYLWSGPNGFNSAQEDLIGLGAGTYTATITDVNGCSVQAAITLVGPAPSSIDLQAFSYAGGTAISCHGMADGSIVAAIEGGVAPLTLAWSAPSGSSSTEASISNLGEGNYCLLVTDAIGCTTERCLELISPPELEIQHAVTDAPCGVAIGAIDIGLSGGTSPFVYSWSNGANTQDISDLQPSTYIVTVLDANGCSKETSATVNGTPEVIAEGVVNAATCQGNADGAIDLSVLQGTAPYEFAWSNGSTSQDLSSITAGTYSVLVTDDFGCTDQVSWIVFGSTPITIDTIVSHYFGGYNVSAFSATDGSVITAISGGTAPYTFLWSNGATTESLTNLRAGSYMLLVTDANGCTAELQVELTQPDVLEIPNAFSPNGDGDNDSFVVHGLDAWPKNLFTVVNRWGNRVYEQPNYKNQWVGDNSQGEQLPNGTYFVILTLNNGERTLQGYVDLRR